MTHYGVGGCDYLRAVLRARNTDPPRNKFSDLRESIKAPGFLDGVLQTLQRVQKEVESTEKKPDEGPLPQRVEVVRTQQTPLEQAITWLGRLLEPLATAGVIFIFVLFALLGNL